MSKTVDTGLQYEVEDNTFVDFKHQVWIMFDEEKMFIIGNGPSKEAAYEAARDTLRELLQECK